jgi:alpha-glucosidase
MLWGAAQDRDLLRYTTQLIDFRRRHPALSDGAIVTRYLDDDAGVWLVERRSQAESVLLAVNLSAAPQRLALPAGEYVTADGALAAAHIELEPVSAVLLTVNES